MGLKSDLIAARSLIDTPESTPLTAYLKGYHAGLAELGITANPYIRGTEASDDWLRGYHHGWAVENDRTFGW